MEEPVDTFGSESALRSVFCPACLPTSWADPSEQNGFFERLEKKFDISRLMIVDLGVWKT